MAVILLLTLLASVLEPAAGQRGSDKAIYIPDLPEEHYKKLGDFNLGIIIPVHERSSTAFCGQKVRDLGLLQRLEAIVFAIEELNMNPNILPNHTLGYVIFDDCYSDLTALSQSLHFSRVKPLESCPSSLNTVDSPGVKECSAMPLSIYDVIGVIGSESSIMTLQAANLLTSFQIPQMSYLATTPILSNKAKYPLFQRTVASDTSQARVILQLLDQLNWTFIYVIYSEGAYGEGLYRAMEQILIKEPIGRVICFAEPIVIREDFVPRDYDMIVWNMLYEKAANVCLVITPEYEAKRLLAASKRMLVQGRITWIASDAWARNIFSLGAMVSETNGLISINIHSASVPRFDHFFQQINGLTSSANPWVEDFWKQFFNCSQNPNSSLSRCSEYLMFQDHDTYHPEYTTSLVFDTVKTYALALDNQVSNSCPGVSGDELVECVKRDFIHALRQVVFIGDGNDLVAYDDHGDRMTGYEIYNVQPFDSLLGYGMKKVGEWNQYTHILELNVQKIHWTQGVKPLSNCSRPCGVGEGMELQQKRCCWACIKCMDNQFTRTVYGDIKRCYPCPEDKWPDQETRTKCLDIIPHYINWHEAMGISLVALASAGASLTVLVILLHVINNKHQLIKASSRELAFFMLAGIFISYMFVFSLVVQPDDVVCFVSMLGVVVAFTIVYAPLLIKTIRIWRIFEAGRRMNRRPKFVSRSSQLAIAFFIVFIHAGLVTTWSVFESPYPERVSSGPGQIDLICRFPLGPFITSMAYNFILLAVCTVFAFKTRKLPDNFSESRFIAFCVFSTLILWLAFIPGYFLTVSRYRALFLALMLCVNGLILHAGLFLPKMYAVYFVENNEMHLQPTNHGKPIVSQGSHLGHFIQHTTGSVIAGRQSDNRSLPDVTEENTDSQCHVPSQPKRVINVKSPESSRPSFSSSAKAKVSSHVANKKVKVAPMGQKRSLGKKALTKPLSPKGKTLKRATEKTHIR